MFTPPQETAWTWGYNQRGQLGYATTNPIMASANAKDVAETETVGVTAIAGGDSHTLALRYDGSVWVWGHNAKGQLGDGTTTSSQKPVQASGLAPFRGMVAGIAAGHNHNLAVKTDGTVWAWGENDFGQLGDGTTTNRSAPVKVSGVTNAKAVAAGGDHSLALMSSGQVLSWGRNNRGQLGNGTTTDNSTPVQVGGLGSGVDAVAAGTWHSVALKGGVPWTWGDNNYHQLGNGQPPSATGLVTAPVQVANLSGVVCVSAQSVDTLALKSDGTGWGWGNNGAGQLGDGTNMPRAAPVQISGLVGLKALAAGGLHSLGLKNDGTVWAWGGNTVAQLGNGVLNSVGTTTPGVVVGLRGAVGVGAGYVHSLAIVAGLASATPGSVNFGAQAVGSESGAQTVTVTNTGSGMLVLYDVTLTGANVDSFKLASVGRTPILVPAGQAKALEVSFAPSSTGPLTASLNLDSNAVDSPRLVLLSGTGT